MSRRKVITKQKAMKARLRAAPKAEGYKGRCNNYETAITAYFLEEVLFRLSFEG